jgi:hypothetical protein
MRLSIAQDTVHTVSAMKVAGKEMKGFMKNNDLKIENIEKLHDEMSDMLVRVWNCAAAA